MLDGENPLVAQIVGFLVCLVAALIGAMAILDLFKRRRR